MVRTMAVVEALRVIIERWMNAGMDFDEREQEIWSSENRRQGLCYLVVQPGVDILCAAAQPATQA